MNFHKISNLFLMLSLASSLLVAPFAPARAEAPCTWDGSSGNWSTGEKWSCGHAPGVGDVAVINAGTVTVDAQTAVGNVSFLGGTLTGGTLIPNTAFDWQGGTLTKGTLFLPQTATLTLSGAGDRVANNHTFNNSGTVTFSGGTLTLENGSTFDNRPSGVFDFQGDHTIATAGPPSTFGNMGLVRKSGGGTLSEVNTALNNYGKVETQSGQLALGGGGAGFGEFNAASGAENRFAGGTYTLSGGASFTGDGTLRVVGGTLKIGASTSAVNFSQSGGTVEFPDPSSSLMVSRVFNREGGTFNHGNGTLILAGGGTQVLTLGAPTTFNNLIIGSGTDLYETHPNQATVTGTLSNYGTLHAQQTISGPGQKKFGLTGVGLNLTTQGTLTQVQVERKDVSHPNATPGIDTGMHWRLFGIGNGFVTDISLPFNGAQAYAKICRYARGLWDCAGTPTAGGVTRSGVTEFSEWAVYNPPERRTYLPLLAR